MKKVTKWSEIKVGRTIWFRSSPDLTIKYMVVEKDWPSRMLKVELQSDRRTVRTKLFNVHRWIRKGYIWVAS